MRELKRHTISTVVNKNGKTSFRIYLGLFDGKRRYKQFIDFKKAESFRVKLTLLLLCFCSSVFSEEYQQIEEQTFLVGEVTTTLKRHSGYFKIKTIWVFDHPEDTSKKNIKRVTEIKYKIVDENDDWIVLVNTNLDDPNDTNYQSKDRGIETSTSMYIIDKKKLEYIRYSGRYMTSIRFIDDRDITGTGEKYGRLVLLDSNEG